MWWKHVSLGTDNKEQWDLLVKTDNNKNPSHRHKANQDIFCLSFSIFVDLNSGAGKATVSNQAPCRITLGEEDEREERKEQCGNEIDIKRFIGPRSCF